MPSGDRTTKGNGIVRRAGALTGRLVNGLQGVYYGWVIVAVAALGMFMSGPGQTYSVSTFIDPLIADFGWSRAQVSGMYSGGTLAAGFLMTVVGRLVDHKGYRTMLTAIALFFACALFFMSGVQSLTALFFGFMMIRTFGQGSLTLIPNAMVPQWFVRRRGRVMSVLAIAGAASSAILPLVNIQLIDGMGWRFAWIFWGCILALVMAPIAWYFTRERPEDLGLLPDNATRSSGGSSSAPGFSGDEEESWDVSEVLRTGAFWIVLCVVSIPSMVGTGAQFHHMSILTENGVSLEVAAAVFTVAAIARVCITPLAGYACDHFRIKFVIAVGMMMQAVNLSYMLFVTSGASAVALGVIQGSRMAVLQLVNGVVWPHFFGRRYLASIRGVTTMAMVISSSLGPLPFGLGYDIFGGYYEVLLLMTALPLLGGVAVLFVQRPKKVRRTV